MQGEEITYVHSQMSYGYLRLYDENGKEYISNPLEIPHMKDLLP